MSNHEELNEFLENLFSNALDAYRNTKEYSFLEEKREQFDAQMFDAYPEKEHPLVWNFAFEIALDMERKAGFIYRQGMTDCIFLLKELGVLT